LLVDLAAAGRLGGRRQRRLRGRRRCEPGMRSRVDLTRCRLLRLRGQAVRLLRELGEVQVELLRLAAPDYRDARLARARQGTKYLLTAIAVIERGAVDGCHLISGTQPELHERRAVAPRVYPEAVHVVVLHDWLRSQHLGEQPRLLGDHAAHALDRRTLGTRLQDASRGRRGRARIRLPRQGQRLELSVAIDQYAVAVDRMELRPAGNAVSDGIHPGVLCAGPEDREPVLRIIPRDDPAQHERAGAFPRRKTFEPGRGVHGLPGMTVMVVRPRIRAASRTRQERAARGAPEQSYGPGARALKRLFLQE